jgi:hypothetical protein
MAHGVFCCRACRVVSPQFFLFHVAATLLLFHSFPLRFAERRLFLPLVRLSAPSFFSHRVARGCLSVGAACQVYPVRPPSFSQLLDGRTRIVYG